MDCLAKSAKILTMFPQVRRVFAAAAVAGIALTLCVGSANAAESADQFYERGVSLMKQQKYDRALAAFAQAI